jgi:hypothetical protein
MHGNSFRSLKLEFLNTRNMVVVVIVLGWRALVEVWRTGEGVLRGVPGC